MTSKYVIVFLDYSALLTQRVLCRANPAMKNLSFSNMSASKFPSKFKCSADFQCNKKCCYRHLLNVSQRILYKQK